MASTIVRLNRFAAEKAEFSDGRAQTFRKQYTGKVKSKIIETSISAKPGNFNQIYSQTATTSKLFRGSDCSETPLLSSDKEDYNSVLTQKKRRKGTLPAVRKEHPLKKDRRFSLNTANRDDRAPDLLNVKLEYLRELTTSVTDLKSTLCSRYMEESETEARKAEWQFVAAVIDRIFFVIFFIFSTLFTVLIFFKVPWR